VKLRPWPSSRTARARDRRAAHDGRLQHLTFAYLIVVGRADLVEQIFRRVLIPRAVEQELTDARTPEAVRQWMARRRLARSRIFPAATFRASQTVGSG